jgi:hypothetical protein
VVNGGAGDDFIGIIGANFTSLNGGGGWNTLVFEGAGITLDLSSMELRVRNFGQFDLNNQSNNASADPRGLFTGATAGNTLQLSLSDILSENGAPGPSTRLMTILGDASSTVQLDCTTDLSASHWAITGATTINGALFDVYHNATMNSNTMADLLIQHGIHVI